MYVLDRKLKLLKASLRDCNKQTFGDVNIKVKDSERALKVIQDDIAINGYSDSRQEEEKNAQYNHEVALNMEEDFWREKSRIKWHSQGDRNTVFFHTYARIRRKTNLINSLIIDDSVVS